LLSSEPEIAAELVQLFLGDGAAHLDRLREQSLHKDAKAMAGTLHAFKGSALQIGAMQVAEILIEMEKTLPAGGIHEARDSMDGLNAAFQEVCLEMEDLISGPSIVSEDTHA
jgi:HPt (histidine-containing phosphotransfer) domain-containing protein